MATLLRMPEIAANAMEAVLQDWSVAEGATFAARQSIATVETEKAVVDVEAEADGVFLKRLVAPGAEVEVGAPIAVLLEPGEQVDDLGALLADLGVGQDGGSAESEHQVVPADPEGGTADTTARSVPEPASAQQVVAGSGGPEQPQRPPATNGHTGGRVFASPLARRLAREAGLAVEEIGGSGPHGRVVRRDVEAARDERTTAPAVTRAGAGGAPASYTEIPHTRLRRAIAARLSESKGTVPHYYVRATIDARRLVKLRAELNDGAEQKVSVNDLVVKSVARAHTLVPEMNVTWSDDAVRQYSTVDVGVAIATDRGLVTPLLRDVDSLSVSAVARATKDLAERARSGQLRQEELEGGSVSVTNLGMYGTEEFAAIINPPQAAILAVGAVREEPVVRKGRLRVAPVLHVTLSVDHRPVDGALAARWMQAFVSLLERPLRILA